MLIDVSSSSSQYNLDVTDDAQATQNTWVHVELPAVFCMQECQSAASWVLNEVVLVAVKVALRRKIDSTSTQADVAQKFCMFNNCEGVFILMFHAVRS